MCEHFATLFFHKQLNSNYGQSINWKFYSQFENYRSYLQKWLPYKLFLIFIAIKEANNNLYHVLVMFIMLWYTNSGN